MYKEKMSLDIESEKNSQAFRLIKGHSTEEPCVNYDWNKRYLRAQLRSKTSPSASEAGGFGATPEEDRCVSCVSEVKLRMRYISCFVVLSFY